MKRGVCSLETGCSPGLVLQRWCWAHTVTSTQACLLEASPSPREESAVALLVTKEELSRSPPGPEQGSLPACPCLEQQLDTPSRRGSQCFRNASLSRCHHQRGQGAQAAPLSSALWQWMWAANQKLRFAPSHSRVGPVQRGSSGFPEKHLVLHKKPAPPRDERV